MKNDDYYDSDLDQAIAVEREKPSDKDNTRTALLPKSFFPGESLEVGKRCTIEVQKIMPEEVMVRYVEHEEEPEETEEPDEYMT